LPIHLLAGSVVSLFQLSVFISVKTLKIIESDIASIFQPQVIYHQLAGDGS
jgi:hypothetical protein